MPCLHTGIFPIITHYSRSRRVLVIQQINHHLIPTLSLYITYKSIIIHPHSHPQLTPITLHLSIPPIPIHFPKTPQFTNPFTPPKLFPLPRIPLTQSHSFPTIPSISLTILETPILPYKSTLFQSTHIPLSFPNNSPYIIYQIKPYSNPNQTSPIPLLIYNSDSYQLAPLIYFKNLLYYPRGLSQANSLYCLGNLSIP